MAKEPKGQSLIDNDFIEEGDPFEDPHEKERAEFEGREVVFDKDDSASKRSKIKSKNKNDEADKDEKSESDSDDFQIEIVDDTPDKDRGKWVANDDDEIDSELPDEDEVKKYSEDVQKRISKMTARIHAERRSKEERDRQMNEALTVAQRLLQENNRLKELVEGGEKVLTTEHKTRLESQLASARNAYREAAEANDMDGQLAAQEQIAKLAAQLDRLSTYRPQPLPREDEKVFDRFRQPQTQRPQPSEAAQAWAEKNKWFENDVPMRNYALSYEAQLVQDGIKRDSSEYYKKIDAEMRKRFPDRFKREQSEQTQTRRSGTVVAPASRANGGANPRKITLTESQVRIARRLNLTPEQYARQLIAEQETGNGKEFTHSKR